MFLSRLPFILVLSLASCQQPAAAPGGKALAPAAKKTVAKLDYNRDVQPILSEYCYHCHGPDTGSRKAKLRLDLRAEALAHVCDSDRKVIVPGKPEASELVSRVECTDPDELMPQDPDKRLKPEQIKMLRRWIAEGAEFRDHWAFEAPVKMPPPLVNKPDWPRNEIDRFVLARLEQEKLQPAAEAERGELLRRLTLDLTGLLPSPAELQDFLADTSAEAYEKAVDRLLASPRYGEHRARYWLDYARYGDGHGLHNDLYRFIWPWRDYVIRSFNADKPFDLFVTEQLAGDLMPQRSLDSLVATGLVRNGVSTGEGGTINEELRCSNKRERTEMLGSLFLGLSTGCAVCHDHKYDPLTQKDFYSLSAFFNNLEEKASNDDRADWPPVLRLPPPDKQAQTDRLLREQDDCRRDLESRIARMNDLMKNCPPLAVNRDGLELHLRLDEARREGAPEAAHVHDSAHRRDFVCSGPLPHWGEETWLWPSFRFETNTRLELPGCGDFDLGQKFSGGGWFKLRVRPLEDANNAQGVLLGKMDDQARGWNLACEGGKIKLQLIHLWPANALAVKSRDTLADLRMGKWVHVSFTCDGSNKAAGIKLYVNGREVATEVEADSLSATFRTSAPMQLARRQNSAILQETAFADIRLYSRILSAEEVRLLLFEDEAARILSSSAKRSADESNLLRNWFLQKDPQCLLLQDKIAALQSQLDSFCPPVKHRGKLIPAGQAKQVDAESPMSLICKENPGTLPYADILARGAFAARTARVGADTPACLPPMATDLPKNRLGLARWLIAPEQPLTARVTVNRVWQELFGTGLVETSEDFGVIGDRPSHRELLDWLAVDFREHGWQLKRLYKKLVMSAAYRQSGAISSAALEKDPHNRMISRGPRFRLDAEEIRDNALFAASLLTEKLGGPSVNPYQPSGVWESCFHPDLPFTRYEQDHGDKLYRRSVYTIFRRKAMMPNMEAFDLPDRSASVCRRTRSNSPLAALVMMNDPQFLEAARHLACRVLASSAADDASRLQELSRLLLSQELKPQAQSSLRQALASFRQEFTDDPGAAARLLKVGESPVDPKFPAPEQAAWMMTASTLMNSDAFLNK